MKDKIIEIYKQYHPEPVHPSMKIRWQRDAKAFADEILQLYRIGMNCEECDWRKVFEQECLSEEKKYPSLIALKKPTMEDCDCRHCMPDRWFLDTDRDIWIKKA